MTTTQPPKGKHGGARPGAGRKPLHAGMKRIVAYIKPDTSDALTQAAQGNSIPMCQMAAKIISDYFEKNA